MDYRNNINRLWIVSVGFIGGVGCLLISFVFTKKKNTHFVCRQIPFKKKNTIIEYICLDFQVKEIITYYKVIWDFFSLQFPNITGFFLPYITTTQNTNNFFFKLHASAVNFPLRLAKIKLLKKMP